MMDFNTGLVVGKFCPLHRGHQRLLDAARRRCGRLMILSYTKPEFDGFRPEKRERWLAELYPDAITIVLDDARLADLCIARQLPPAPLPANDEGDDVHRRFVAWLLHTVLHVDVDAVFTSEAYGDGFAAVLSDAQQQLGGPPVVHIPVDPARVAIPVSGTAIRSDVHGLREWLAPVVYRDFVRRVGILGGESTGKSTLAAQLASRLQTMFTAEYGRELWEEKSGALEPSDLLDIARVQVGREETLIGRANAVLLCDTTPLTTMLYSQAMFGAVPDALVMLGRRQYDVVFLCAPDVPFVQDGTRRDEAFRHWQHEWYLRELETRRTDYVLLQGSYQQRLDTAIAHLSGIHG
jgi:NadR type nicotinamide-nucleotide adenylyltransferase